MREVFYNGAHGNMSVHVANATVNLNANDSAILIEGMPIGTEIIGIKHITANLGASTTAKIELVDNVDSKTTLINITTSAADVGSTPLKPIYIDKGPCDLLFTNKTGSAVGEVYIQLEYRFKGY